MHSLLIALPLLHPRYPEAKAALVHHEEQVLTNGELHMRHRGVRLFLDLQLEILELSCFEIRFVHLVLRKDHETVLPLGYQLVLAVVGYRGPSEERHGEVTIRQVIPALGVER